MVRSKLRKKFPKSRSERGKKTCNKQRNKYISLLRKTRKAYYSNLNVKDVVDNKVFFFSDKLNYFENISLTENGNLLTDDFEIAETFNF